MVSEVLSVMRDLAEGGLTMMVVTHEMRFAREVSSRVFYMDRGEVWEAAPPEQIVENPQRPETRAFVFRIRSWEWAIDYPDFDHPAMEGSLEDFCARQFLGRRLALACGHVVEELASTRLASVARDAGVVGKAVRLTLTVPEGGETAALEVDCHGLLEGGVSPEALEPGRDAISDALVAGYARRLPTEDPAVMRFEVA